MRWLAGAFLIAHGLVHLAIWLPKTQNPPFDVNRSPFAGDVRAAAQALAVAAAVLLVPGGAGLIAGTSWWAAVTVAVAAVSAALLLLTFSPWFLVGLAINAAIIVLVTRGSG